MKRHDDATKEWGPLRDRAIIPSAITYEPKINSRTVHGERTKSGEQQNGGAADGGANTVGESQEVNGRTVNREIRLVGQPGQVEVPVASRADINAHGFWKQGTTTMFDIRIVNLYAGSYLRMTPEKALPKA